MKIKRVWTDFSMNSLHTKLVLYIFYWTYIINSCDCLGASSNCLNYPWGLKFKVRIFCCFDRSSKFLWNESCSVVLIPPSPQIFKTFRMLYKFRQQSIKILAVIFSFSFSKWQIETWYDLDMSTTSKAIATCNNRGKEPSLHNAGKCFLE